MEYKTYEEARKVADMENKGRDYGTAIVVANKNTFTIKII